MLDDRKDATMSTRPLLYCGLLAPMALVVGVLVEDATRPGYSPWRHAVSQLSLGPGWPVNLALLLLGAVGLLALAIALPRALPTPDRPRWTPRLVATAGTALALLAIFPIDPGLGYPPGQPVVHHWQGPVHGIVGTALFAALAAAGGGPVGWRAPRPPRCPPPGGRRTPPPAPPTPPPTTPPLPGLPPPPSKTGRRSAPPPTPPLSRWTRSTTRWRYKAIGGTGA